MVSNSASDDGSTEVSSSLGLLCLVPLIILELGQTEISLAIDKKENKCKKMERMHTYQAATSVASFSKLAAFSSATASSYAFAAAHCSSSPNDASTGLVQCLSICPKIPHLLHLRCFLHDPLHQLLSCFSLVSLVV